MRDKNPFNLKRVVPKMSWNVENLYSLWLRTTPGSRVSREMDVQTGMFNKLFKQRWVSKRLTKQYHAEHISAKKFERWYLPSTMPLIRKNPGKDSVASSELSKWVEGRSAAGGRSVLERKIAAMEKEATAPVATLMFTEVERRIDSLIFRACFASSVWQARNYVVGGHVKVNGRVVRNPNTLLNPGDMFTINPKVVPFIAKPDPKTGEVEGLEAAAEDPEEAAAEATESAESTEAAEPAAAEATEGAEAESPAKTEAELAMEAEAAAEEAEKVEGAAAWEAAQTAKAGPYHREVNGTHFSLPYYASPHIFVPAYILPSYLTCSAVYLRHPTARPGYSEIPSPYSASGGSINSLSWEWYQRHGPRMRENRRARLMNPQREQDRK